MASQQGIGLFQSRYLKTTILIIIDKFINLISIIHYYFDNFLCTQISSSYPYDFWGNPYREFK